MISFLGIGSNLKDRKSNLIKAVELLKSSDKIEILEISSIYESLPVSYINQSNFFNMVIKIDCKLLPKKLLEFIKKIEINMGRIFYFNNGPRVIDIDILSYGDLKIYSKNLNIPHLKIKNRRFVLLPWSEIGPNFKLPNEKKNISEMLIDTKKQNNDVWKIKN